MAFPPLVSVITPTYNHEKFIASCIQSVIAQSFSAWEMVIINDGSTDGTAEIIGEFARQDERIRVFNRANVGIDRLSETYNFGLEQCRGRYIAILEGDDLWEPEKLHLQVAAMEKDQNAVLCWGRASEVSASDMKKGKVFPVQEEKNIQFYSNDPAGTFFNIVFDDFPVPATFLIRRGALEKIGGFLQVHPFPSVDLPTVLALSLEGHFIYIPAILGSWRQHGRQVTKNNSVAIILGSHRIILDHFRNLKPQIKALLRFDEGFIERNLQTRLLIGYSRAGRFKLLRSEFRAARADYLKALAIRAPLKHYDWKLRSLVGLIFSFFHTNVEGLAKLLGKKSY